MFKTYISPPRLVLALLLAVLWTGRAFAFNLAIGVMQPGESIQVTFEATISPTLTPSTIQIVAQGTISATSVTTLVTDDPETTSSATDSTKTPLYNNPPVLDLDGGSAGNDVTASFTEQTPVLIAPAGTMVDQEGNPIKSLKATLPSRPNGNAVESLSLNSTATAAASGASLTVSYTTATGVLLISSVSGSSTNVFQTVLRGILYNNTSDSPATTSRTANVVVNDGNDGIARVATVTVATIADTPSITSATTSEDTQTSSGLVISRNAGDGTEVTHFKITGIAGGALFQNDGTTVISDGDFITFAQGNAGLTFTPAANVYSPGTSFGFSLQASLSASDTGLGGSIATATATVNPVADTPSVTGSVTSENTQTTTGLVISRNAADGAEITHFKITGINNGTLFQNDGVTVIGNGDFITSAQGNAGLKFTPPANLNSPGSSFGFTVQASLSAVDGGLGGSTVSATITVTAVNDPPVAGTDTLNRAKGRTVKVLKATLLANDTDADGPSALTLTAVTSPSTGGATVRILGDYVVYEANAGDANDSFTYTVSDGADSATGTVNVTVGDPSGTTLNIVHYATISGERHLTVAGIPGRAYKLQLATSVSGPWSDVAGATAAGNATANGEVLLKDTAPPTEPPTAFYRAIEP